MLILTDHKELQTKDWEANKNVGQDEDPDLVERIKDMEMDVEEAEEMAGRNRAKICGAEVNEIKIRKSLLLLGLNLSGNDRGEESSDDLIASFREDG